MHVILGAEFPVNDITRVGISGKTMLIILEATIFLDLMKGD